MIKSLKCIIVSFVRIILQILKNYSSDQIKHSYIFIKIILTFGIITKLFNYIMTIFITNKIIYVVRFITVL